MLLSSNGLGRWPFKPKIGARFPVGAPCGCSSVVERHVANVDVEGSSPSTRSILGLDNCACVVILDREDEMEDTRAMIVMLLTRLQMRVWYSGHYFWLPTRGGEFDSLYPLQGLKKVCIRS